MKTLSYISLLLISGILFSCTSVCEISETKSTELKSEIPSGNDEDTILDDTDSDYKYTLKDEEDIPWYAIENEHNDEYWANVNCSKVWVEFKTGVSIEDPSVSEFLTSSNLSSIDRKSTHPEITNYYIFNLPEGNKEKVLEIVFAGQAKDFILFIEPQNKYSNNFEPNDTFWNQQWGPYVVYADEAWNEVTGNSLNVIAVIDDAVDYTHEDLSDQVQYGWDYGFNDADPAPDVADQMHGTHVTGTIAATIDNGIGIAGMVNDTVYFAKVTDVNYDPAIGNFSDGAIVDALYDISEIDRIGVINMSLGGPTPSTAMEAACNYAWNQGKVLCAASGNDGTNIIGFPAAFESCIAIGAIGTDGESLYLADYSQFGFEQEVVAPGGDINAGFGILSTLPGNDYGFLQGTSMATPHVTGLIGLIQAYDPSLSNVEVRNIMQSSCLDLGDTGWDQLFGFGLINASNAIALIDNGGVGLAETEKSLAVAVYPNPTTDYLRLTRLDSSENLEIILRTLEGKIVKMEVISAGVSSWQMDFPQLISGLYLLEIYDSKGLVEHHKISIQK